MSQEVECHLQRVQGGEGLELEVRRATIGEMPLVSLVDEFMFDGANVVSHAHASTSAEAAAGDVYGAMLR